MPRKRRTAKKIKRQVPPVLLPADRERLQILLDSVDPEGAEDAPPFVAVLEFWDSLKVPSSVLPAAPCYRCRGGEWLTGGVEAVVTALQRHAG